MFEREGFQIVAPLGESNVLMPKNALIFAHRAVDGRRIRSGLRISKSQESVS